MGKFEFFGFDELDNQLDEHSNMLETDCPVCGQPVSFFLSDIKSKVTCPHCGTEIELESK